MANQVLNSKIALRNDTAANWTSKNPVLLKGELGIESDTRKFKFGDGVTAWNTLPYASATSVHVDSKRPNTSDTGYEIGTLWIVPSTAEYPARVFIFTHMYQTYAQWSEIVTDDMLDDSLGRMLVEIGQQISGKMDITTYDTNDINGYVDNAVRALTADSANTLLYERSIGLSGDIVGTPTNFNGGANIVIPTTLSNTGVTAGTYTKVTVDAKGRVTVGANLAVADIPNLTLAKITDAGSAASKNVGTAQGNVPVLGANGKLDENILPSIAITEVFVVASQAAMLALTAQTGDVAIRTDLNKSFILSANTPTVLNAWVELKTPADAVLSVNGKTGTVVLTTSNIAEGTNLYYTEARATANFKTHSSKELTDTASILYKEDTFIVDCGNA